MRVPILLAIALACWTLVGVIYFGGRKVLTMIDGDSGHPVAVNATVERRIHLVVDTEWDTDKRRKFECREIRP